jgi:PAS domain S-box-containing protein
MANRDRNSRAPVRGRARSRAADGGSNGATPTADGTVPAVRDTALASPDAQPAAVESDQAARADTPRALAAAAPAAGLLQHAVEEAARLLRADGAMIYLLDESSGVLNYAFDAGISGIRERRWIRRLELPLGAGMFGVAAAQRRVTLTHDYPSDDSFRHSQSADRFVAEVGLRSMVVAPLVAGDRVFGAMGTFAKRPDAFDEQAVALVRSLADHAAAAMANAILIDELARSQAELERRAEAERSLREIATRISAIHAPADVIQRAVDEAARLLGAEGARIDLIDPANGLLRWAYQSGADRPSDEIWPEDPEEKLDQGVSGKAVLEGRVFVTGDYLVDDRFIHRPGPDSYIRSEGITSVMAAPLVGDRGPFGSLTVYTRRAHAWDADDADFLDALATEAAIAIQNARLIEELGQSREALAVRAEAEQALREIAARITAIREPSELLQHVVDEARRLVRADGGILDLLDHVEGGKPVLRWSFDTGLRHLFDESELEDLWIPVGSGATGIAVAEDRVVVAHEDPRDQFPDSAVNDAFFDRTGFQSMIIAPISSEGRPLGALEVYSTRPSAFTDADAGLIRALADQAAIAIQNARLIEELASSRAEIEQRADAERTLREIAARITAIRDPDEILQQVIDAATRLLRASGAMINLVGVAGTDPSWAHMEDERTSNFQILDAVSLEPRAGVSGLAIATGQVAMSGDYLADERFNHTPERDEFVRSSGIRSVVAAPVLVGDRATGAITVYSPEPNAFSEADAALLKSLADQAAVTITNAQLIDQLERAREEVQRRADAEHALRQISANISSIRDSADVLQQTVNEAARLLRADGGIIDLLDEAAGVLRWAYDTGEFQLSDRDRFTTSEIQLGKGIAGRAVLERRVIRTGDYLDHEFTHTDAGDDFATQLGIRSVIAAPILGEAGPVGAIEIYARRPQAFDDLDAAVLGGLADQAAIAIQNARLIEALDKSRDEIRRRGEAERSLREIAANISAIRDADVILQQTVDEARRLLRSSDVRIDLVEGDRQIWAYTSAGEAVATRRSLDRVSRVGDGVSGKAITERRIVRVDDYLTDTTFDHTESSDRFVRESGLRSVLAVPLIAEGEPLGAISAASDRPAAYDDADAELLQALAHQATIAIQNARLIEALEESKENLARRADAERSLREMAGRIAELRDPDELLRQIVDDSLRLIRSDGAHLTRMSDEGTHVVPVVVAGALDPETEAWLMSMRFPLMGGINGLAAGLGQPVWTNDYTTDERIPREADDLDTADKLGLRGMAAVPLRSAEGRVIGTLAVSFREPHTFQEDELAILKALADHASIAITNSSLYERLRSSEGSYRHLVQNSPDLVWSIDAEARFSFLSDTCERLTGWRPEELLGKHFGALVHEQSRDVAEIDWTASMVAPTQELRGRLFLLHRDGHPVPAEFTAMSSLDEAGQFAGATGSVRDMTERDRLERELRGSEERYRFLVENSPDIVFSVSAEGDFTYVSETIERALGYRPEDLIGKPFADVAIGEPGVPRGRRWAEMEEDPSSEMTFRYMLVHRDGRHIPFEVSVRGLRRDGNFAGVYGAARDMSDRERLERELRQSEERYRFLVQNSPDVIFATDPDGVFSYISETVERLVGRTPADVLGRHFSVIVDGGSMAEASLRWQLLEQDPDSPQISRLDLVRADDSVVPVEVSAIGMTDGDGRFRGITGSARDVTERVELESDLRQQAAELAAGEERAHLARELHDSVTQALFSMTLLTRTTEMLLDRDPDAARKQLVGLRELQREALAEMRALIFELRPGNLEQDGLIHALKTHSAALQGRIGLPIVVKSDLEGRLPIALEEVLYRIAQEGLHNIVKHAGARQVRLELGRDGGALRLRIIDDGKGFDPAAVPDGHLGLAGMRARAEKIGASFAVRSRPGGGTTIEVTVDDATIIAAGRAAPASDPTVAAVRSAE